jgi:hypothetical protein
MFYSHFYGYSDYGEYMYISQRKPSSLDRDDRLPDERNTTVVSYRHQPILDARIYQRRDQSGGPREGSSQYDGRRRNYWVKLGREKATNNVVSLEEEAVSSFAFVCS